MDWNLRHPKVLAFQGECLRPDLGHLSKLAEKRSESERSHPEGWARFERELGSPNAQRFQNKMAESIRFERMNTLNRCSRA